MAIWGKLPNLHKYRFLKFRELCITSKQMLSSENNSSTPTIPVLLSEPEQTWSGELSQTPSRRPRSLLAVSLRLLPGVAAWGWSCKFYRTHVTLACMVPYENKSWRATEIGRLNSLSGLTVCPNFYLEIIRYLHKAGRDRGRREQSEDSDSDSSDDDSGDDDDQFRKFFPEDVDFPNNFRETKKFVKSLRVDAVLGGGLGIARSKIQDHFLESKILINGEKLLKKSRQLAEGDYVDLVSDVSDGKMKVKRVRLVKVGNKTSSKDRYTLYLRSWRGNVTVDVPYQDRWQPKG